MKLFAPDDRAFSRPFRFRPGGRMTGPRLGGAAPAGIPTALREGAEFLLTFPLASEPALEASIFRNCPFEEFLAAMNRGFQTDDRILVVAHEAGLAPREDGAFRCSVTPCRIVLGDAVSPDLVPDGEGGEVRTSRHKLGGEPHSIQEPELPGARELFGKGYIQVLQVDFPGLEDGPIAGDWPFLDGLFNVFWKTPFTGAPYYWYLQK